MTPLIRNATRCAFIVCLFCHASAIVRLSIFRHSFIPFPVHQFLTFKRFSVDLLQPPSILFSICIVHTSFVPLTSYHLLSLSYSIYPMSQLYKPLRS